LIAATELWWWATERIAIMQTLHTRTTTTATEAQRAAVAELMASIETPFGRPSITMADPTAEPPQFLIISPADPVDEPDDE
jgi:hypothetical protein